MALQHALKQYGVAFMALWISVGSAHAVQRVEAHVQPALSLPSAVATAPSPASVTTLDLGAWQTARQATEVFTGGPHPIGKPRPSYATATPTDFQQSLQWQQSAHGSWIAAISIRSPGAYGMRLGVLVDQLPGSTMLRLYTQSDPESVYTVSGQRILQILQANLDAGDLSEDGRTWWTPESNDEEVTLEIELPPGIPPSALQVAIPRVMHIYENVFIPVEKPGQQQARINEAGRCNLDVNCHPNSNAPIDAVARLSFIEDGISYLCTGTLINDSVSSGTPYFLTANHCINNQTTASTLETYWFYRSPSCDSRSLSSKTRTLHGGSVFLYGSKTPDFSLVRLNDTPPAGAVFAGWDISTPVLGSSVTGVHQPNGDLQKISFGQLQDYESCTAFDTEGFTRCESDASGAFYAVRWNQGITESGSSGSGLFLDGKLIGVLTSGTSSCSYKGGKDTYGQFSAMYPAVARWLSPDVAVAPPKTAVYRFLNRQNGTHFYTANTAERDDVLANYPQFQYEGIAFYIAPKSLTQLKPVVRFFNRKTQAHFYTISESETQNIIKRFPQFQLDGTTWFASTKRLVDTQPLYRFAHAPSATHFYTTSSIEKDMIQEKFKEYKYEGIAYYVWKAP